MEIYRPHHPTYKSDEFWYDHKEAVLLYENKGEPLRYRLEAVHPERGELQYHRERGNQFTHHSPHGLEFKDSLLTPQQRTKNAANAELIIRLCDELGLAPQHETGLRHNSFLPVPKFLAIFLEANRTEMHKAENLNQAISLMQTRALVNRAKATNLPDTFHG